MGLEPILPVRLPVAIDIMLTLTGTVTVTGSVSECVNRPSESTVFVRKLMVWISKWNINKCSKIKEIFDVTHTIVPRTRNKLKINLHDNEGLAFVHARELLQTTRTIPTFWFLCCTFVHLQYDISDNVEGGESHHHPDEPVWSHALRGRQTQTQKYGKYWNKNHVPILRPIHIVRFATAICFCFQWAVWGLVMLSQSHFHWVLYSPSVAIRKIAVTIAQCERGLSDVRLLARC